MRIENYLNADPREVADKKHNIWVGISLGNKYFTKERIEEYIGWAIANTRESVLIVVGDYIHAINLEVLDGRTQAAAMNKALTLGDEKFQEIEEIISRLPSTDQTKVRLVRWKDALENNSYQKNFEIIKEGFKNNTKFRDCVLDIVKEGRKDRASTLEKLSGEKMNRLAEYILNELPLFIDGVRAYGDNRVYTLLPYPGLSKLDTLSVGLQNKTMFPGLAEKLNITHKTGVVEAYPD